MWADRNEDCNSRAMVIEWALPIHVLAILSIVSIKVPVNVRYRPIAAGQRSPTPHESAHVISNVCFLMKALG